MSTSETEAPKIGALVPWFGCNRMLAAHVGELLADCEWVGIPFMGGGPELVHIQARTIVANDLHKQVINLANVLRHPALGPMLIRDLRRLPYHAVQLHHSQQHCLRVETRGMADDPETEGFETSYVDALNYFVCAWMGRSALAGTPGEFNGALPVRWNANGGDSAVRFCSAVESLRDWRKVVARANFTCMDCFDFLKKCKDAKGHAIYCDPPFPDAGEAYRHRFTDRQHSELMHVLSDYDKTRVVCRFYQHPLIEKLYPRDCWRWIELTGRKQSNGAAPEVLLVNDVPRITTKIAPATPSRPGGMPLFERGEPR